MQKNKYTNRRFKSLVRILKSLCVAMQADEIKESLNIPGFLIECLIWNVPNSHFKNGSYYNDLRSNLIFLYDRTKEVETCKNWGEVSELIYLFHSDQKWTRKHANVFIVAAWNYVGYE